MCIHHENNNSVDLSFSIRIRIGARSIHVGYSYTIRLPFTLFQKSSSSQESYIDSDIRTTPSPTLRGVTLFDVAYREGEREGDREREGEDILYNVKSPRYLRITVERFVIGQTTLFIITRAIFVDVITLSGRYPTNPGH